MKENTKANLAIAGSIIIAILISFIIVEYVISPLVINHLKEVHNISVK